MEDILKKIKENFDPFFEVPLEHYLEIKDVLKIKKIPAKTIIKRSRDVESSARYILEGGAGLFTKTKRGYECIEFYLPDHIACDFLSYSTGNPSERMIKTFAETVFVEFRKASLQEVAEKFPGFGILANSLTEHEFQKRMKAQMFLKNKSGKERYMAFIERFPKIREIIIQKDIAHLLHMTPEALSRIIKQLDDYNEDNVY